MIKFSFPRSIALAYAGLLVTSAFTGLAAADDSEGVARLKAEPEGVVRANSSSEDIEVVRGQSPHRMERQCRRDSRLQENCPPQNCPQEQYSYNQPGFSMHSCPGKDAFDGWLMGQCELRRMRQSQATAQLHSNLQQECHEKSAWARCKFGYFIPTGSCGKGTAPLGVYSMVYPVNPSHFDARDGQVYAAQGYGGAVSIPMAPVVNHTYNYGWGMPSSRLTPVSHPVSPAQADAFRMNQMPGPTIQ